MTEVKKYVRPEGWIEYEYVQGQVPILPDWEIRATLDDFSVDGWELVDYKLEPYDEDAECYHWLCVFRRPIEAEAAEERRERVLAARKARGS